MFNTSVFWYVFTVFHVFGVFYMSLQIYYVGRFKLGKLIHYTKHWYVTRDWGIFSEKSLGCNLFVGVVRTNSNVMLTFIYSDNGVTCCMNMSWCERTPFTENINSYQLEQLLELSQIALIWVYYSIEWSQWDFGQNSNLFWRKNGVFTLYTI